ncbi:hypothetical protein ACFWUU_12920 [Kribbella sp. NPDC058693]|uniref:hypothetical protein n=1 Tax=Kribbella sp. NPDC058693 TaxID=3346602 RepID=UPI003667C913
MVDQGVDRELVELGLENPGLGRRVEDLEVRRNGLDRETGAELREGLVGDLGRDGVEVVRLNSNTGWRDDL